MHLPHPPLLEEMEQSLRHADPPADHADCTRGSRPLVNGPFTSMHSVQVRIVLSCSLLVLNFTAQAQVSCMPGFQQFEQKVDHFNSSDTRTFQQNYLVSDYYYKPGGPILFLAGFEAILPSAELCASTVFYPLGWQLGGLSVRPFA